MPARSLAFAPRLRHARIAALAQLHRLHEAEVDAVARWPELAAGAGLAWDRRRAIGIDVGAALGVYTGRLRRICRLTLAVEPHPRQAARLAATGWDDVVVVEAAASNRNGDGILAGANPARAYQPRGYLADGGDGFPVRTLRLDTLLARYGATPARDSLFVKIDAQGHEAAILAGLGAWLASGDITLLVEVEPHLTPDWRELVATLAHHRLRPHAYRDEALVPVDLGTVLAQQSARFPRGAARFGRLRGHAGTFFFLRAR